MRFPQEPECSECFPGVHPFNVDAVDAYLLCSDQFIVGAGGPVALNLIALGYVLDNCFSGEIDKLDTIERVKVVATVVIGRLHEGMKHGKASS